MDKITVRLETGYPEYPFVEVTYDGNKVGRFFSDDYIRKSAQEVIAEATDNKDAYNFVNYIFAAVNQAVKRHYTGQDLMLESVRVLVLGDYWITISR